jgi:hypothetical protein
MTTATIDIQIDLAAWARDLDAERKRVRAVNAARVRNRGYLVFATDPSKGVDSARAGGYPPSDVDERIAPGRLHGGWLDAPRRALSMRR